MSDAASKDFGPIRDDYEFFVAHATEEAEDLRAYEFELREVGLNKERLAVLDFGCGDGRFTAGFLAQLPAPAERIELSLVEPEGHYRQSAVKRLQARSHAAIQAWPALPVSLERRFDLILANHVFYYVPDLGNTLSALLAAMAGGGTFVTAMAGRENGLIQFWIQCFAMLGRPVPYHLAEKLEASLERRGQPFARHNVAYELRFPDGREHRESILRFLLGDHLRDIPRDRALALFDPYAQSGTITMPLAHHHYLVRRRH